MILTSRNVILFLLLALFALAGCGGGGPAESVATEVVMGDVAATVTTRVVPRLTESPATMTPQAAAEEPAILDLGLSGSYETLDPQLARDKNELTLVENLFAGLTRLNHQTASVEPFLASEWEVSSDGLTWTFYLRDDVYWIRSGTGQANDLLGGNRGPLAYRPVVADDVVYAVQRACDPATANADALVLFVVDGCESVNAKREASPADLEGIGVHASDDATVTFRLTEPASYFETITSMPLMRPVPREVVEAAAEEEGDWTELSRIVTSGPFYLHTETDGEERTVLERNPYWPLPFAGTVDRANIFWMDAEDAYDVWLEKGLDVVPLPVGMREDILGDARLRPRLHFVSNQQVFYVAYNFESPVFADPFVRRAFGAAIDREALIEEVYGGFGLPMQHFTPPGVVAAPEREAIGTGYKPDLARRYMLDSSLRDCGFMPKVRYLVGSTDLALFHAETLRGMWMRELGCPEEQIEIEQVQLGTLLASTQADAGAARPDMWDLGWVSYYPDSHNWLADVLHCNLSENRQLRSCSSVDQLVVEAAATMPTDARGAIYTEAERLFFGEGGIEPVTPLFVQGEYVLIQPWLSYAPAHFGGEQFDTYNLNARDKRLEQGQ